MPKPAKKQSFVYFQTASRETGNFSIKKKLRQTRDTIELLVADMVNKCVKQRLLVCLKPSSPSSSKSSSLKKLLYYMHTKPKAPYCLLKLKKLRFGDYYKY